MDTQHMMDNAATASQARQLLNPITRGAVLRSFAQFLEQWGDDQPIGLALEELRRDPEFND